MKKQRGSAILIAIFLVAAIGGIAFSLGKVFLLDTDIATISENGVSAYYAAESGIEEGLLRYRYNKDAEVPFDSWQLGNSKVFRSNINTGDVVTKTVSSYDGVSKLNSIADADNINQIYDLRMGFIGTLGKPFYGQDTLDDGVLNDFDFRQPVKYGSSDAYHDYSFLLIPKDETYKISLDSLKIAENKLDRDVSLYANFVKSSSPTSPSGDPTMTNSVMYMKLNIDYNGDGTDVKEYKTLISSGDASQTCALVNGAPGCSSDLLYGIPVVTSPNPGIAWKFNKIIASFLYNKVNGSILAQSKITLSLRPLFNDAYIGLSTQYCTTNDCAGKDKTVIVPGPFATITSTGYFDGVARTIEANVDRQSGTLYDLFDYVIFEKQ